MTDQHFGAGPRFDVIAVGGSLACHVFAEDLRTRLGLSVAVVSSGVVPHPVAETIPLGSPVGNAPDALEILADGVASFSRSFHDAPGVFNRTGHVVLAPDPTSVAMLRWAAGGLSMAGAEASFVCERKARSKCETLPPPGETPRTAFGALWCAFGGIAATEPMRRAARDLAIRSGVRMGWRESLETIEIARDRVTGVRLADGRRLDAATVVCFEAPQTVLRTVLGKSDVIGRQATMVAATQPWRVPLGQVIESVRPRFTLHVGDGGAAIVYAPIVRSPSDDAESLAEIEGAVASAIVDLFPGAAGIRVAWRNRIDWLTGADGVPVFGMSGRPGLALGIGLDALGPWVEHAAALRLSHILRGDGDGVRSWSIDRFAKRSGVGDEIVGIDDRDGLAPGRLTIS